MQRYLALTVALLVPAAASANEESDLDVSVSATYVLEGDNLYVAEADEFFYVGDGVLLKGEAIRYLPAFSRRFGVGVFLQAGYLWYDGYEEIAMVEAGPAFSWRLQVEPFVVVPTLYFGYRHYGDDAGDGLGINVSLQARYPRGRYTPFLDVGFLTQPTGGNDDTDITFSPVFTLGAGLSFGL